MPVMGSTPEGWMSPLATRFHLSSRCYLRSGTLGSELKTEADVG
jgi:hypothetical protein